MPPDSTRCQLGGAASERLLRELAPHRVEADRVGHVGTGGRRGRRHRRRSHGRRVAAVGRLLDRARLALGEAALEDQLHVGASAQPVAHAIEHGQVRVRRVPLRSAPGAGLEARGRAPEGGALRIGKPGRGLDQGPDAAGRVPQGASEGGPVPGRARPGALAQPVDRLLLDPDRPVSIGGGGRIRPRGGGPQADRQEQKRDPGHAAAVPPVCVVISLPAHPDRPGLLLLDQPVVDLLVLPAPSRRSRSAGRRSRAGTGPARSRATLRRPVAR